MKMNFKRVLFLSACTLFLNTISAQTFNDGPMELQIRVTEVRVDYHPDDNQSNDFNLSGSIGSVIGQFISIPSLETDEISCKVWVRDNVGSGWQGGTCLSGDLPMVSGGPESYSVNPAPTILNYGGTQVPQFIDLKLEAWEDDVPGDFDQLPAGLSPFFTNKCQTSATVTRCTYDGTDRACFNVIFLGDVFDEKDDIYANADPFQTGIDYRADGPPCEWNDHGWSTGVSPQNNYYQVRFETYYRFTLGISCASPFDLGTLNSGGVLSHLNNNKCYTNTLPGSQPGNDVFYKFHINNPMGIDINLCNSGTLFDTYVYLLDNNCTIIDFNDDGNSVGCGIKSLISRSLCTAGDYYVVVDAKTATSTGQFQLFITENPTFTFSATIVKTDPSCAGYNDGGAEVNASPVNPAYTYLWDNGSTDTIRTGLTAGTYRVTVTNPANGCTISNSVTLVDPQPVTVSVTTTNLTCSGANDGSATAAVTGGTFPYNYAWNSTPPQVGSTAVLLPAGTYNVTVADLNGCTATNSGTVSATNPIVITVTNYADISCNGADDGAITISVSGGQPSYTYNWSNGAPSSPSVSGLSPGPIDVAVFDNTGTCNETMAFDILEPALLVSTVNATRNVTCNGGNDGGVDLGVSGGTLSYTYQWSGGETTGDLLSASAGAFSVTVSDANGCTHVSAGSLTEPTAITSSISVIDAGCYGNDSGVADLTVSGGTAGYTFYWSNNETTQNISSLPAGDYLVVITDASGCILIDNVTVTEFTELDVQISKTNPSCIGKSDGKIVLTVNGNSPTISWSDGTTDSVLTNLAAGSYTATVTDANSCTQVVTFVIEESTASCGGNILDVAIPNVFSPNGDGTNDFFDIYAAEDVSKIGVKIYDRWGTRVYDNPNQLPNPNQGWNGSIRGKEAQLGSYVYVMEIAYSTPANDRPLQKTGTVTVVR